MAGRYHSLMLAQENFPEKLVVNAVTDDGIIMGIRHIDYLCYGIQFHPESILTQGGDLMVDNFFKIVQKTVSKSNL
jgi:anthranilate synthase component 2